MQQRKRAAVTKSETETETETEDAPAVARLPSSSSGSSRFQRAPGEKFAPTTDVKTRTIWTLIMVFGFFAVIAMGHFYVVLLCFFLNSMIFKEILQLRRRHEKENNIPYFHFLNWYFFLVTWYFLSVRWLGSRLDLLADEMPAIQYITHHHTFKSFALYIIGFVTFVASLQKGLYRYQFGQFAWSHMTLLFITCQSSVMIVNIFDGIVWFFLGTGLVIWNDVFAYIFGRWLGKTPLIQLSPKKTWEGFIGSFVTTLMFSVVFAWIISLWPQLVCPQEVISFKPFLMPDCTPNYFFQPQPHTVPSWIYFYGGQVLHFKPILIHALAFAVFASLIAPFGGFFASGFKRAFKIKDFGDTIPGHGGITDRMDCQIIMSLFVYIYRSTFLGVGGLDGVSVLTQILKLNPEQQLQIYNDLTKLLTDRGLLAN